MGLEFSLRIAEMTELVQNGACCCVHYCCRIKCSFDHIILLHQARGRGGEKNLGDLKGDLRAIYTRCVSICSAIMVWQSGTGCASGVGSVCRVSLHLTGLVNGTRFGKIIESVRLSFLLPS